MVRLGHADAEQLAVLDEDLANVGGAVVKK
jgi:hypothetical protein